MAVFMKQDAAAFTAAGFYIKVVRVVAASYLMACYEAFKSSKMHQIYQARCGESFFLVQPYDLDHTHLQ